MPVSPPPRWGARRELRLEGVDRLLRARRPTRCGGGGTEVDDLALRETREDFHLPAVTGAGLHDHRDELLSLHQEDGLLLLAAHRLNRHEQDIPPLGDDELSVYGHAEAQRGGGGLTCDEDGKLGDILHDGGLGGDALYPA